MAKRKILAVEDEQLLLWAIREKLSARGYQVLTSGTGEEAIELFTREQPDLVLLDITLPGMDGLSVLRELRKTDTETAIIMVTARTDIPTAVDAIKYGADNYITKPFVFEELLIQVDKALQSVRFKRELKSLREKRTRQYRWSSIIGTSPAMQQVISLSQKVVASSPTTVLLLGESGTGKDLIAQVMHQESSRRDMPFIEVNANAIPDNLLESELMGHEKGAFTDAKSTKKGLFELADEGTIFLNEIGDMPAHFQAKLLQIIESRRFRRVGGTQDIEVDIWIMTATNKPLVNEVAAGRFRQDLYYRLNVLPLVLPPLRDRGNDVLLLSEYFLKRDNARFNKSIQGFSEKAKQMMMKYSWPGNVRELSNVIERAVILCSQPQLESACLSLDIGTKPGSSASTELSKYQFVLPEQGCRIEEVEKELIIQALDRCQGNQTHAAQLVGLSRDAFRYRMQKFGLLTSPA